MIRGKIPRRPLQACTRLQPGLTRPKGQGLIDPQKNEFLTRTMCLGVGKFMELSYMRIMTVGVSEPILPVLLGT